MKRLEPTWLLILIIIVSAITWVNSLPTKDSAATTRRVQYGDSIKDITSQLMSINGTLADITFDTRTPPKIQQQLLKKITKKENPSYENSHPGIAVPVNEEDLLLEDNNNKKYNFYKVDKPTTDGGLSTWVLLNSHTVAPTLTTKPTKKTTPPEPKNVTTAEIQTKTNKPIFKKRPTTTTTPVAPTTLNTVKPSTLTVKAATEKVPNKNKNEAKKPHKNSTKGPDGETKQKVSKIGGHLNQSSNELLPAPESKVGELELNATDADVSKKPRRPAPNKKKNKKKRRRPASDKADTDITTIVDTLTGTGGKPFGTQIYNYLSREIIPTVGVGLVGLVVTAGLASYFLYPFGVARRSYEVDRKDKDGTYFYNDEYGPGAVDEEEVIGKVIAGMPVNSKNYRSQSSKNIYSNIQYSKKANYDYKNAQPQVTAPAQAQAPTQPQSQATVEALYLTPDDKYNEDFDTYVPHKSINPTYYNPPQKSFNPDIIEYNQEKGYTVDDKKFVVGNTPKSLVIEEVTPVVVPEHGPRLLPEEEEQEEEEKEEKKSSLEDLTHMIPQSLSKSFLEHEPRSLKIRKRRSNDVENETEPNDDEEEKLKNEVLSSSSTKNVETSTEVVIEATKPTLINTIRELVELKIKFGLEFLQNTTKVLSRYLSEVQTRFKKMTESADAIKTE